MEHIIHPITGQKYNINSDIGKEILKDYINEYKSGGSRRNITALVGNTLPPLPPTTIPIGDLVFPRVTLANPIRGLTDERGNLIRRPETLPQSHTFRGTLNPDIASRRITSAVRKLKDERDREADEIMTRVIEERETPRVPTKRDVERGEDIIKLGSNFINQNYYRLIMPYLQKGKPTVNSLIQLMNERPYRELVHVFDKADMSDIFIDKANRTNLINTDPSWLFNIYKLFTSALESRFIMFLKDGTCTWQIDCIETKVKSSDHYHFPIGYILNYLETLSEVEMLYIINNTDRCILHHVISIFGIYYMKSDGNLVKFNMKNVLSKIMEIYKSTYSLSMTMYRGQYTSGLKKYLLTRKSVDVPGSEYMFTTFHLMLKKFSDLCSYISEDNLTINGSDDEREFMLSLMKEVVDIAGDDIYVVRFTRGYYNNIHVSKTDELLDDLLECAALNEVFFNEIFSNFRRLNEILTLSFNGKLTDENTGFKSNRLEIFLIHGMYSDLQKDGMLNVIRYINERTDIFKHCQFDYLKLLDRLKSDETLSHYGSSILESNENIIKCLEYIRDEDIFLSGLNYALYPLKSPDQIINDDNILTGEGGEPWGIVVGRRYNRVEKVSIPIEGGEGLTYYKHYDEDEGVPVTLGELFTDSESVLLFCKNYNEFIMLLYELFLSRGAEHRMDLDKILRDVKEFKEWSMIDVNIALNLFNNKHTRRVCYYNLLGSFYNFVSFFDLTVRYQDIFGFEGSVFGNTWMSEIFGEGIQSSINLYFGDDNLLAFNPFYNKEENARIKAEAEAEAATAEAAAEAVKKRIADREKKVNNEFYNMASITSDFYPIGRKPHPIHIVTYEDKEIALKIGDTMIWADNRITEVIKNERRWEDPSWAGMEYVIIEQLTEEKTAHFSNPLSVYTYDIIDGVDITYKNRIDEIIEKVTEMRYIIATSEISRFDYIGK